MGRYGSHESKAKYARLIAEEDADGAAIPLDGGDDRTVAEIIAAYLHDQKPYVDHHVKNALKPVRRLYGDTPADRFGPSALRAVRQAFIDAGLSRSHVNAQTARVRRTFKWAVEHEPVPPSVLHGLQAVASARFCAVMLDDEGVGVANLCPDVCGQPSRRVSDGVPQPGTLAAHILLTLAPPE